MSAGFASLSVTRSGAAGNAGGIEVIPCGPSLEDAQAAGIRYAVHRGEPPAGLSWRQVSGTSWLLMSGGRYTGIGVAWVTPAGPLEGSTG
jgi:hypothetical protein